MVKYNSTPFRHPLVTRDVYNMVHLMTLTIIRFYYDRNRRQEHVFSYTKPEYSYNIYI